LYFAERVVVVHVDPDNGGKGKTLKFGTKLAH